MKKIILLLFLLFPSVCHAALPAGGVIEIRSTATAANLNGGGFNSARGGHDYTLSDSAALNPVDLTTTGAGATTITTVLSTFTSDMVGNYIHITSSTSGFQNGWYEIITFTDAQNVILDHTPSSGAAGVAGVGYVGGAMSLNSSTAGRTDDDLFEIGVAGNKFWIKGNITLGNAVSTAASGGTQNPIIIEGYTTTRGDGTTAANVPIMTQAANAFTLGTNWDVYNMSFTGTADPVLTIGLNGKFIHSKVTNTTTSTDKTAASVVANGDFFVFNSEFISYRGRAFSFSNGTGLISGCYFHDSDAGFKTASTAGGVTITNSIIADNVTAGLSLTAGYANHLEFVNDTFYGAENKLGIGASLNSSVTDLRLANNIFYGFTTGVSHGAVQSVGYDNYNDYNNNTGDVTNWTKGANDSTAAPTFTNVTQLTDGGRSVTSSTNVLTDSGASFTNVVDSQDFCYISAGTGTGIGLYKYLITSHTSTTLTLSSNITSSGSGSAIHYQVTLGHDFSIGTNLKALGFPGAFPGGLTTGYLDIGATQRQEPAGGGTTDIFGVIQ